MKHILRQLGSNLLVAMIIVVMGLVSGLFHLDSPSSSAQEGGSPIAQTADLIAYVADYQRIEVYGFEDPTGGYCRVFIERSAFGSMEYKGEDCTD